MRILLRSFVLLLACLHAAVCHLLYTTWAYLGFRPVHGDDSVGTAFPFLLLFFEANVASSDFTVTAENVGNSHEN